MACSSVVGVHIRQEAGSPVLNLHTHSAPSRNRRSLCSIIRLPNKITIPWLDGRRPHRQGHLTSCPEKRRWRTVVVSVNCGAQQDVGCLHANAARCCCMNMSDCLKSNISEIKHATQRLLPFQEEAPLVLGRYRWLGCSQQYATILAWTPPWLMLGL